MTSQVSCSVSFARYLSAVEAVSTRPLVRGYRFESKALGIALGLSLVLTACASRPKDVLTPVADTVPSTSRVAMLVTTTRARSDNPGEMFTGERALTPSFAEVTVSIPPPSVRKVGEVAWPKKLPPNPATDFAVLKAEEVTKEQAQRVASASVRKSPDHSVLVFIHGFNNRFEDSVYRFAQIAHDTGTDSAPILVTWPSRGSTLAYGYDRESTNYTRDALETLFQYLARDPEIKEVSVLAHSMGNWLALESLRQMAIRNGRSSGKVQERHAGCARCRCRCVPHRRLPTWANSTRSSLFSFRRTTAHWLFRAGFGAMSPDSDRSTRSRPPYKEELEANNITVIDLTKVKSGDKLNHGKFAESPQIVQLIGSRISQGQRSDRQPDRPRRHDHCRQRPVRRRRPARRRDW